MLLVKKDPETSMENFAGLMGWIDPSTMFESQFIQTMKLENPDRPTKEGFIRPSSLTPCIRKMVFEYQGVIPESTYDGTPRIGESGTDAHTRIQNYVIAMKDHGYDVEYLSVKEYLTLFPKDHLEIIDESAGHTVTKTDVVNNVIEFTVTMPDGEVKNKSQRLTDYMERYHGPETLVYNKDTKSRFKADGIIKYNGVYYIFEIKTENTTKFNKHKTTKEPYEKHKLQGTYYANEAFGIDKVMYLYEHRDSCKFFISIFEVTDAYKKLVRYIIEETLRYGDNGWVAPRTIDKDECRFCPFKERCNQLGDTLPR